MDTVAAFLLKISSVLYAISAVATLSQVVVFSSLGAKRLSLFIAMFACFCCNSIVRAIALYALSVDNTFLSGATFADQQWIKYVYQFGLVFLTAGNMTLGNICLNMWALLQFKDGFYRRNSTVIRLGLVAFSFVVGLIEIVIFAATCNNTGDMRRFAYANLFSLFYVVIVGGFCLVAVAFQLFMNRKDCMTSLAQSNISLSLLYRMIVGLLALIVIGASSIYSLLLQSQINAMYYSLPQLPVTSNVLLNAIIGLALSVLFGSSEECLNLWRGWIKICFGIDLTPKSNKAGTLSVQTKHEA